MGDKSDDIPGVRGVGEKTAMELVRQYGGIAEIYGALGALEVKDSVRQKLADGRKDAALSFELATIRRDAPIEFSPEDSLRREPDNDALYTLFKSLEFNKLIERLGLTPPAGTVNPAAPETARVDVTTRKAVSELLARLKSAPIIAVRADAALAAVAVVTGGTAYIAAENDTPDFDGVLRAIFDPAVKKAGHEVKDTLRALFERGVEAGGYVFDAALAAYLLSPTERGYDLRRLAEQYCGYTFEHGGGADGGQLSFLAESENRQNLTREAIAVAELYKLLPEKLRELGLESLFERAEMPLCAVLAEMERAGFLVDKRALTEFGEMLTGRVAAIEAEIYAHAGGSFNINSPKQLAVALFEELALPAPKKTKTGFSTNIDVLERLIDFHPIIRQIIEYRQLTKLKATYADGLLKVIGRDGRIHTSFQMTVTSTGRLSSTEPNLQNIPVRRELGRELRRMFVAGDGNVLVDADYSQIELRLLAHIADDAIMRAAFLNGEDIHAVTASQVWGVPLGEVTPLQRSRAKAVNFGIVYGISAFSLAQDVGVSVKEAKKYMESYFEKYSGVRTYMKNVVEQAKRDGYVSTLFGRRLNLPELKSSDHNTRAFGERVALNMPVQGTAADIMKLAMVNVCRRISGEKLAARLLLQVHDELIVECPEREAARVTSLLREEMENAASLSVPLTAEAHSGKSWYDAK
jgi:DNA polymerase-1